MPDLRSGQVTQKMVDAPDKRLFVGIGALEAASQLLGFIGASKLPGDCIKLASTPAMLRKTSQGSKHLAPDHWTVSWPWLSYCMPWRQLCVCGSVISIASSLFA